MKIKIKRKLQEMSAAGAVAGFPGGFNPEVIDKFNKEEEDESKLKGTRLEELLSTSTQRLGIRLTAVSGEKAHAGHLERSQHQGLRNVVEEEEEDDPDTLAGRTQFVSDSDMDSVDREFFADRQATGQDGSDETPLLDPQEAALASLREKGYEIKGVLGKGSIGHVFLANTPFKQPAAIKIVRNDFNFNDIEAVERELNNYQTISDAREGTPILEKHFPKVFESWSPQEGVAIIAMEVLKPLTNEQASFIPDASFLAAKYKPHKLGPASDSFGGMRDVSKRFTHYLQRNSGSVAARFEYFGYQLVTDREGEFMGGATSEKMDELKKESSPEQLSAILKMADANPTIAKQFIETRKSGFTKTLGAGSAAVQLIDILEKEAPEAFGANAAFIHIAFKIMLAGLAAEREPKTIDAFIADYSRAILISARQFTQIPMGYAKPRLKSKPGSHEKEFLTSKGLNAAIRELYKQTGLMAKDLHDQNVMARANGDLVIVDVGLFRKDTSWVADKEGLSESRKYKIKITYNGDKR